MFDRFFSLAAQLDWTIVAWVVVSLLVLLQLLSSIRIVGQYERLAVFFHGHFQAFKGPGLVMTIPTHQKCFRVPIGAQGVLMADDVGRFDGIDLPVRQTEGFALGAKIQVTGFDERAADVSAAMGVSMRRCPKCGHEFY